MVALAPSFSALVGFFSLGSRFHLFSGLALLSVGLRTKSLVGDTCDAVNAFFFLFSASCTTGLLFYLQAYCSLVLLQLPFFLVLLQYSLFHNKTSERKEQRKGSGQKNFCSRVWQQSWNAEYSPRHNHHLGNRSPLSSFSFALLWCSSCPSLCKESPSPIS